MLNTFLRKFWDQNPFYNLQVVYAVLCAIVSPIFSFFIFEFEADFNNIYINVFLPVGFLSIAYLGIKTTRKDLFFFIFLSYAFLVTAYCINIVHHSHYSIQNALAFLLVFLGISIAINKWYYALFYHILVVVAFMIGLSFSNTVIIDPLQFMGFLLVTSIISFGVLFPMNKIFERQIEFNTYLENIIDEANHGIIVININEKEVVKSNAYSQFIFKTNIIAYNDIKAIVDKIEEEKDTYHFQYEVENQILEIKINATRNLGPEATHMINLFDITEIEKRKKDLVQLNKKYAASKETYESLFESASEYIVILDESFSVINANESICEKFDIRKKEFDQKTLEDIFQLDQDQEIAIKSELVQMKDNNSHYRFKKAVKIASEEVVFDTFVKRGKFYGKNIYISTSRDITLQEQNRNIIETSRDHLAKLLESIDYVVFNIDIEEDRKHIKYLSPKTKDIFGISVDEYITQYKVGKINHLFHPDDVKMIYDIYEHDIKKDPKPRKFQYRFFNKQKNKYIWIEEKVFPKFRNGEHVASFGIATDVSTRREYEEKIKESEKKYKSIYQNNSAAIFYAREGLMIDANKACAKLMGYDSVEDFINTPIANHHVSEEKREVFLEELLGKKKIVNKEWPFKRKDGSILWTLFNAKSSEKDAFGNDVFECTFLDITELKETTNALQESENKYKLLFTEARDTILLLDQEFVIQEANDWTAEMFGLEIKEIIGKNIADFAVPEYSETQFKDILEVISKEQANYFEWKFITNDSEEIDAEVSAVITKTNNQFMIQMIIRDMSKWIEKERIIEQSRQSFKNITDYTPEAILIKVGQNILYANNNAIELLNTDEEQIFTLDFYSFFDEDKKAVLLEQEKMLIEKDDEVSNYVECDLISTDGNERKVGVRMLKTKFLGQDSTYIFINDLSVRLQLEKEQLRAEIAENINRKLELEIETRIEKETRIKELERYTRSIIDSSIDTIVVTDKNGNIQESNEAIKGTFKYNKDEVIGSNIEKFFESAEEFEHVKENILKNKSYIGEFTGRTKKGTQFPGFITISPLIGDQGKVIGNVSIIRDISEIKETKYKLDVQNSTVKALFESASNSYLWILDKELKIISFNPKFEELIYETNGVQIYVGMKMKELAEKILPPKQTETLFKALKKVKQNKEESFEGYIYANDKKDKFWLESYLSPIILPNSDKVIEIACISHDVNEKIEAFKKIKNSLKEKEILLKEVHHRVKNNLQVISSILNLQTSYVKDPNTLNILKESQDRIKSMSFIHENLYQTKNFSSIKFSDYIVNISKNLVHSYQIFDNFVDIKYDFDEVDLNLDQAIPCGLIVNELISNALKHAFDEKGGTLKISVKLMGNNVSLGVEDDGKGIAKDFDLEKTESLGLQLVHTLVDQLDGEITLSSNGGTKYLITFEKQN